MGMTDINSVRREDDEQADDEERDQLQFSNGSSVSEIRRFEIAFDRPEALYFSGDSVTGEVQISLEDTIHVKGVVVRFVGEAYVNVPVDEEGNEGSTNSWQKRCKNLRTLASMRKRNKVKPSGTGMSNHGFSTETKANEVAQKEETTTPHANGGHKVKCESAEDDATVVEPVTAPEGVRGRGTEACDTEVVELEDEPSERPQEQQQKILETVKEEEADEDQDQPKKEVRFGEGGKEAERVAEKEEGGDASEGGGVYGGEDGGEGRKQTTLERKKKDEANSKKVTEKHKPAATVPKVPASGAATTKRPQQPTKQDQTSAEHGNKKKTGAKFRSHEKYFDYRFYVFGHKYSSAREHLSSGAHRFRFSYVLPGKLPTSFHGKYGYVRYFCEASLERAWAPSITRKALFSVSASVDVNREPRAESGAGGHRSTHGCLFCCPRGTVMAEAGVRRRGFVPGERIPLRAHILNISDRCVRRTRARLLQRAHKYYNREVRGCPREVKETAYFSLNRPILEYCCAVWDSSEVVTYHSINGYRSKVDEVVVTEAVRGEVPRGEADTWDDEDQSGKDGTKKVLPSPTPVSLEVPPLPANFKCSEFCKIIDVDYRLDFMVEVEGEPEPLHIRMPIVVGTVPLERVFRTMVMGPRRRSTSSAAAAAEKLDLTQTIVPGSMQYIEFPLPSYEPCTWGPRHVEAYFHQEVVRKLGEEDETTTGTESGAAAKVAKSATTVAAAGATPGVGPTLRVHRKGETFAPRYVCYRLKDPDALDNKATGESKSVGELTLSPVSPDLKIQPSEAWIPRDTSETELVSPGSGPSKSRRH